MGWEAEGWVGDWGGVGGWGWGWGGVRGGGSGVGGGRTEILGICLI